MTQTRSVYAVLGALAIWAAPAAAQTSKIERGKYLAEEVAHCQVCHTRRLAGGELDRTAWLKGGVADISGAGLAGRAPDITSGGEIWKVWREDGMSRYLKTGKDPAGKSPGAHMPPYQLRPDDAEAVTSHLKSLK